MNTAPTKYAIRVRGHLDHHWSTWLGEPDMVREDDGTTTLTASIADQAQLHGVLAGLRDIGATITELRIISATPSSKTSGRRGNRPPGRSARPSHGAMTAALAPGLARRLGSPGPGRRLPMTDEPAVASAPTLDEAFLRDFSARWHAAWNSHDHAQVAALCTSDVEWHDPSLPEPGHGEGVIAGLMETLVRACPDFRFEETEPAYRSPSRPKAIAPWRFTGTMTGPLNPPGFAPTGGRVEFHGDDHWDFRGELICRCEAVYDANSIGIQIGAAPAPRSGGERLAVMLQRLQARRLRRSAAR